MFRWPFAQSPSNYYDMVRKSLIYPITVLWTAGLGLLLFPVLTLQLLQSSIPFEPMIARFLGRFFIGLASFVSLTYYFRLKQLYIWTIYIRLFFLISLVALFSLYKNLLFGIVLIILVIGIGLTILAYQFDKNEP